MAASKQTSDARVPAGATAAEENDEFSGVSELASPTAGAAAPFGDVEFPLPLDAVRYTHPGKRDRPNLAGD